MKDYRIYTDDDLLMMRSLITKDLLRMQSDPSMDYYLPDPVCEISRIDDELISRIPQSILNEINVMKVVQLYTGGNPFDGKHPGLLKAISHLIKNGYQVIVKNISSLRSKKPEPGVRQLESKTVYLRPFIVRSYFRQVPQEYFDKFLKNQPLIVSWQRNSYEVEVMDVNNTRWIINSNWVEERKK